MQINLDTLYSNEWIVLEAVSGSHAYGLATPQSDTDIRGIFILPEDAFFGLNLPEQVNDPKNDIVFYELKRVFDLLIKNNPNILELTAMPQDSIRQQHPLMNELKPEIFLSKLCRDTFAGYAKAQIYKAQGLNKKVVNPMPEKRKTVLDFCYVPEGQGAVRLLDWLEKRGWKQENCGLTKVPHMREIHALYHDPTRNSSLKGIMKKESANEVLLSSIPKGMQPETFIAWNKDGYTRHCKEFKDYWAWVEDRNEARYQSTIAHNKQYDAKNMMHTFRLLNMSEEIAREGKLYVRRPDREMLMGIRNGEFEYEDLVKMATEKLAEIDELYESSDLPEKPDHDLVNDLLVHIRKEFYRERRRT